MYIHNIVYYTCTRTAGKSSPYRRRVHVVVAVIYYYYISEATRRPRLVYIRFFEHYFFLIFFASPPSHEPLNLERVTARSLRHRRGINEYTSNTVLGSTRKAALELIRRFGGGVVCKGRAFASRDSPDQKTCRWKSAPGTDGNRSYTSKVAQALI